jgi:peptidoglycan hydrolase-like protein with peptidoglycan-binding domain
VPSRALRQRRAIDSEEDDAPSGLSRLWWWRLLLRRPRDSFALVVAAAAVTAITVNGLFLQHGPHPAPIFAVKPPPVAAYEPTGAIAVLPRPRPADPDGAKPARTRAEIIADVQRELARRGYYDGAVDGVYGAKTDAAIRDFEQTLGFKPSGEPSEALLQKIMLSTAKAKPASAPARKDPSAEMLSPKSAPTPPQPVPQASTPQPSQRIIAIQRALSEFGYGQIRLTGVYDTDTKMAIQRFERDRKLPITGEMSERVIRELAALAGRPLD